MLRTLLVSFVIALFSLPAFADDNGTSYGLSMHGKPKYTASDTHLDYANPDAPKGGSITMDAVGTFDTLNPFSLKGKAAKGLPLVYDRLMARVWDEPFTMYPLIAEKVDVPEDHSSITVHINPKAQFHDGSKVTAEDVVFTFETLKTHGRPNMRQIYKLVDKMEKRDDMTVYFHFGPGYDRETAMIIAMMPVLSKKYWEGRNFEETTLQIPLLNGPYKILEFDPGRRIVYERVPDYWAKDLLPNVGHNNFDRIAYEYYRDETVAVEGFKAGNTQLRREENIGRWNNSYKFPAVDSGSVKLEAISHQRPDRARGFFFNTRRAPFDDIRVRKALDLLFDSPWVNENLFRGEYKRIESYFPNSELAATGAPEGHDLDILNKWKEKIDPAVFSSLPQNSNDVSGRDKMREADRLLKEAGWIVENGKRVKDGKPFKFEILLGAPEDEKIAINFKRSLEKMGIDASIRIMDAAAFIDRVNNYDYDMLSYFILFTLSPGTEQPLYWGCQAAKEPARWNFAGVCNPAVDELAGSIASSKTREELVARVHALDRILLAGHYMIPLFYSGKDYVGYWQPVERPEKTPLYGMVLETWWMKPPENVNQH